MFVSIYIYIFVVYCVEGDIHFITVVMREIHLLRSSLPPNIYITSFEDRYLYGIKFLHGVSDVLIHFQNDILFSCRSSNDEVSGLHLILPFYLFLSLPFALQQHGSYVCAHTVSCWLTLRGRAVSL